MFRWKKEPAKLQIKIMNNSHQIFSVDAFTILESSQVTPQRISEHVLVAPQLGSVSRLMCSYKSCVLSWRSGIEFNFNTGNASAVILFDE